jgi:ectoine hydroxylase-related dioxygenase (phytanoyl-CoA dioxygenase family)
MGYNTYVLPMWHAAQAGSAHLREASAPDARSLRTIATRFTARDSDWFVPALESVRDNGFAIVEDVLEPPLLRRTRDAMYRVHERILAEIGPQRLSRAGDLGVLRLMLCYDAHFYALLELEELLAVVDASLSSAAVLHVQDGRIDPPAGAPFLGPSRIALTRDFRHHLNGYVASLTTILAIDAFTPENGAPLLVPGSHQEERPPGAARIVDTAVPALCPAGAMIVLDSTLWHTPGSNRSGHDRLSITQQFTRPFVRPQVDYVAALGDEMVQRRSPRTQQLLGRFTRCVGSIDECYPQAPELQLDGT